MLLFLLLFSIATLVILLIFNPNHDPRLLEYSVLLSGLVIVFTFAYGLNRSGHYTVSAMLLVACAAIAPWVSILMDPAILQGDFVPLTYLVFSIMLSSILLPTYITFIMAILQFAGAALELAFSPAFKSFNWFSFLDFVFLTIVFSILSNYIIRRSLKQIEDQAHQLALNEERLQEQSIRDYLTGLFNRRYLEETLEREIQRATRKQVPLGVIMLDINHFKRINDMLGHAAGDTVLRELCKFLAEQVRQSDIACRYGGDEFVLVLPDASRDTTKERARQLQEGVKDLFREYKNQIHATVTISAGVAVFPEDGSTVETILNFADTALYRSKHDRSKRVVAVE